MWSVVMLLWEILALTLNPSSTCVSHHCRMRRNRYDPIQQGCSTELANGSETLSSLQNCELNRIFFIKYLVSIIYILKENTLWHMPYPSILQETNIPTYTSWWHICLATGTSHQMQTPYQSKGSKIRASATVLDVFFLSATLSYYENLLHSYFFLICTCYS